MSVGVPYLGSKISLISKMEIRYEGVLYSINPRDMTIGLSNVRMFGTEGRRKALDGKEVEPDLSKVYEFIIFKSGDIKDLTVCETPSVPPKPEPAAAPKPEQQQQQQPPMMPPGYPPFAPPPGMPPGMPPQFNPYMMGMPPNPYYMAQFGGPFGMMGAGAPQPQVPAAPTSQPTPEAQAAQPAAAAPSVPQPPAPAAAQAPAATAAPTAPISVKLQPVANPLPAAQAQPSKPAPSRPENGILRPYAAAASARPSVPAGPPQATLTPATAVPTGASKPTYAQQTRAGLPSGGPRTGQQTPQQQQQYSRGGGAPRRGGHFPPAPRQPLRPGQGAAAPGTKFDEFDFESANKRFDKEKLMEELRHRMDGVSLDEGADTEEQPPASPKYDKQKDFFDAISCETLEHDSKPEFDSRMRSEMRRLDAETFGSQAAHYRSHYTQYRGGYRGGRGGRGGYQGGQSRDGNQSRRGGYGGYGGRGGSSH